MRPSPFQEPRGLPVPTRMTCWVQEGISFEAPITEIYPVGVFVETNRADLRYTESVRIQFSETGAEPVAFEGFVATWVRGRGVRIEVRPDTPPRITRVLEAWAEGRPAPVESKPSPIAAAARGQLDGRRVLVIDDDPGILKMMRRRLKRQGCEVSVTTSPPSGLDHLDAQAFDAVVMDWMLPSIPGQELLQRVHGSHPNLPVAVVSGALYWDNAEQVIEKLGASAVMHKPLDFTRLVNWLEEVTLTSAANH
ncbi:MAG: response regulator [Deltaproteobacteria bacterium]